MSFVFQDVVLFNDTVMNNIRIGRHGATDDDVRAAARMARCDEFIDAMPQGYETIIGENGSTLSGGERQRISIARALLKNAPIVLLDEATASLDPENETQIQEAISELVAGRTVIVIAHRLRTVMGANKIIVLENGRLIEEGTSEDLLAAGGLFARMHQIQTQSLGWGI
jgi:ATP-binding cassette subfamily B protein